MEQLRRLPDDELGRALAHVALSAFPPTPDLTAAVQARLEREALAYPELQRGPVVAPTPARRFVWPRMRRATALAILAILLLAAIAAAVIFGVPGIRFTFVSTLPTLSPTPAAISSGSSLAPAATPHPGVSPSPVPSPRASILGGDLFLGEPVSLDEARSGVPFHIQLPHDALLGAPDQAFLQQTRIGHAVTFVWGARPDLAVGPTGLAALLTEFEGQLNPDQFQKIIGPGTTVTPVFVAGVTGYWLHGADHFFVGRSATGGDWDMQQVRLAGDTLLWNVGRVTYRLELALPRGVADSQDVAIRVAQSLAP
jgi:hypothetical protein